MRSAPRYRLRVMTLTGLVIDDAAGAVYTNAAAAVSSANTSVRNLRLVPTARSPLILPPQRSEMMTECRILHT